MTEESDDPKNNLFTSSSYDWVNKTPSSDSIDDWSRAVVDGIDRLCCDGEFETLRGPAPSLPLHDLVLEHPQKHLTNQGLPSTLKSTTLLSSHRGPSA
jgi:hypothetical protein